MIGADVGVNTVMNLIEDLRVEVKKRKIEDAAELQPVLSEKLTDLLRGEQNNELKMNPDGITVILFVGVNGVGKTTTIGKLAHRFKQQGKKSSWQLEIRSVPELLNSWKYGDNVLVSM